MKIILNTLKTINKILGYPALLVIIVYQKLLSADHAFWARPDKFRICTYYPSCSEFSKQAVKRFGLFPGAIMGFKRIIDCNPFSKAGHDPVPDYFTLKRYKGKDAKPVR